ncbi:MAG: aldose epimerase family protein [Candidatus Limivicinus sp.]|nr:aldose epimerase family protein [Candidatus Limivicinus sp.]
MVFKRDFCGEEEYLIDSGTMQVSVMALGATVTGIALGDRQLLLRYGTAREYLEGSAYIGALVGRYANRIGGAAFDLNGRHYTLTKNEGENQLHGGPKAFDKRRWRAEIVDENSVRFSLFSPDGDNGFPGNLHAAVTYSVSGGTLRLDFEGESDADTLYAPTTHMYFNLDGADSILDTVFQLNCAGWLETGEGLIPTGRICPAEGRFDFSSPRPLGGDFDHCFVLRGEEACTARAGEVTMGVRTDYPAIQLYTGGGLGAPFGKNRGFAVEPEFYPDSPNHPEFPSPVLRAGERFHKYVEYCFDLRKS